jgi:hypothetical protein
MNHVLAIHSLRLVEMRSSNPNSNGQTSRDDRNRRPLEELRPF